MPSASKSVCTQPGCGRLAAVGVTRCAKHQAEWQERRQVQVANAHKRYNERRPETDSFYKTERWKKKSQQFRLVHPLCAECEKIGLVVQAKMVDHIKPYRERPDLAFDDDNLRALCWPCHNRVGAKVRDVVVNNSRTVI